MNKFKNVKNGVLFTLVTLFSVQSFAAYNDMHKAVDDNNSKEIERLLTKSPTMLQEFDDNGNTPIHKAIMENKNSSLQTFIKFKRTINTQINNRTGETPLVFAIKNKKYNSIIFMLDNGINPFYKDRNNKNSLDYVKETGDITTKQIYNEFYARNRDKIKSLQESYTEPVDLSLWKGEEKKIVEKKTKPKVSTVQDLLIGNSKNKKLTTPVVAVIETPPPIIVENKVETKIEDKVDDKSSLAKVKELSDKLEKLKIETSSVIALQDKITALESQNDYLKRKIEIKAVTGKDDLTPEEENVAKSKYAGIYEQQLIYGDITTDEAGIPNFDDVKVVSQTADESLPVIGDVIDYKSGSVKTLNNIEQEFPTLSYNINTAIKNDIKVEQVVLPIDKLPESQVIVNVPDVKESIKVEPNIEQNKQIIEPKPVEISPLKEMTTKDIEKPVLTIVKTKENLKQEFSNQMSSDNSIMLILGLISLGLICFISYGVVSYMDYKKRKIYNNKTVQMKQQEKQKNKDISIEVTDKDKI